MITKQKLTQHLSPVIIEMKNEIYYNIASPRQVFHKKYLILTNFAVLSNIYIYIHIELRIKKEFISYKLS